MHPTGSCLQVKRFSWFPRSYLCSDTPLSQKGHQSNELNYSNRRPCPQLRTSANGTECRGPEFTTRKKDVRALRLWANVCGCGVKGLHDWPRCAYVSGQKMQ